MAFQKGPNTNTNIIQFSKNDRIRILFGFPKIHSGEKSNKCKQCEYAVLHAYHSSEHLNTHSRKNFHNFRAHLEIHRQMQPLQECTGSNRKLEDADENAQWEKLN